MTKNDSDQMGQVCLIRPNFNGTLITENNKKQHETHIHL